MTIETKNETSREITATADLLDGLANKASRDEELPLMLVEAYCRQASKLLRRLNSSIMSNKEWWEKNVRIYLIDDEVEWERLGWLERHWTIPRLRARVEREGSGHTL